MGVVKAITVKTVKSEGIMMLLKKLGEREVHDDSCNS